MLKLNLENLNEPIYTEKNKEMAEENILLIKKNASPKTLS